MPASAALAATPARSASHAAVTHAEKLDEVRELQARIREMQSTKLDTRALDTSPTVAGLLPGGALRTGVAYSIEGSTSLAMALMAGPSAAGAWCGVVGVPSFGTEAAAAAGIDLDRLALVPYPGDQWLPVTAALADVLTVVLVRPPLTPSDGNVSRLMARLRERGSTLIVLGRWPGSEARLEVTGSAWGGLGDGHGHLTQRTVTVGVTGRAGSRERRLVLP
jgi:membrane protein implicated in regulation of membrane protease activity